MTTRRNILIGGTVGAGALLVPRRAVAAPNTSQVPPVQMIDCGASQAANVQAMFPNAPFVLAGPVWKQAQLSLWPNAVIVRLAHFATDTTSRVLDIENGYAQPGDAPGWAGQLSAGGVEPKLYCSHTKLPAVLQAMTAYTGTLPWWLILAEQNGTPHDAQPVVVNGRNVLAGTQWYGVGNAPGSPYDITQICNLRAVLA